MAADTSSGAARHLPLKGKAGGIRADTTRSCAGCRSVRDEPWAGERETAHRCMAAGPQQGRVVGFDKAWNNLIPAWCPKRVVASAGSAFAMTQERHSSQEPGGAPLSSVTASLGHVGEDGGDERYGLPEGTPLGLQPPEIYGSRGAVHPGAAEAPKEVTRAAANVRWRALKEELGAKIGPSQSADADSSPRRAGRAKGAAAPGIRRRIATAPEAPRNDRKEGGMQDGDG